MRESWEQYFLGLARYVARRSTCLRRQVGAVAVRDRRILATGYNGAPSGMRHCHETGCLRDKLGVPSGERHELCLHGDTKVKLLDGTYPAIRELAQSKDCFWVYSCDLTSGQVVPALARFPRKTGKRKGLVKVCLDNGSCILCTQDHRILKRDGTYCEASKLKTANSLMPMYYNFAINNGYESISNTIKTRTEGKATSWKNEFFGRTNNICTHKLVYEYINGELQDGYITHHKNKILTDNRPENLSSMPRGRHSYHHNTITGLKIPKEKALWGHNHKVVSVKPVTGEYDVYDLTVPLYENFAVDLGDNSCVFVHNCRATHAEQNVICQAARFGTPISKAGLYIAGGTPCLMCAKMLINVKISWIITDMEYPDGLAISFLKQAGTMVEIMKDQ